MKKNLAMYGVTLALLTLSGFGCRKEQPPPPQTPAQAAPAAATAPVQTATPQNPGQVQVGMTTEQVRQIMGAPTKIEQEGTKLEWKYYTPQGKTEIKLQNDKVIAVEHH